MAGGVATTTIATDTIVGTPIVATMRAIAIIVTVMTAMSDMTVMTVMIAGAGEGGATDGRPRLVGRHKWPGVPPPGQISPGVVRLPLVLWATVQSTVPRLAIDGCHRCFRIACAGCYSLRGKLIDAGQITASKGHVQRSQVLLQITPALRPRNWDDIIALCQHPGERQFSGECCLSRPPSPRSAGPSRGCVGSSLPESAEHCA